MAIQPCYLINDDYEMVHYGVALVDTVSGLPLPLSRNVLTTLEEAEAFLLWVREFTGYDARKCDAAELEKLGLEWRDRHVQKVSVR